MIPRALLFALLSGTAFAQGKPTLIDYPLDVKAPLPAPQSEELQGDFRQQLARNPAVLVSTRTGWKVAISALKRQDCDVRDECLQQLAITASTLYALYASVEQNAAGTEVTATGRVVNQDRVQVRARLTVTVPRRGTFNEAAREALNRLLGALELEKLSGVLSAPVRAAQTPEPVVSAPAPHEIQDLVLVVPGLPAEPKEAASDAPRVGAWVSGGLGVAAAGVAVGFGVSALGARDALPADGRLLDGTQARAQAGVNRDATIALATSLAAAALLGTSALLFIVSGPPPAPRPVVGLAPVVGGAQVTLTGEFGP